MRILYCTDTLMAGGTEHQLTELLKRLDRSQFEPELICLQGEQGGITLHFAPALRAANVPLHIFNLQWKPFDILRSIIKTSRLVWRIRPAILHGINHHGNHVVRLARPFLPISLKVIAGVRTEYNARQLFYERLEQWACDVVESNSPQMAQKLVHQSHIPANKVVYIPNGVDVARFSQLSTVGLREQIAPGADRVLAMVARISVQKSPHLLAQAVGLLKERGQLPANTRVLIVGERESLPMQGKLDEAIRQYQLEQVISVLPQTSQPEVIYHAADATVLATLWEGLPNVALESLAAGRPVLISEAANAAKVIEQDVTGWIVRTGDVDHLAEMLHHVLTLTPDQLNAMRPACLQKAKDFDMAQMVSRYQDLYLRLSAKPIP